GLMDAELLQTSVTAFVRRAARSDTGRPAALLLLDVDQLDGAAQAELAGFLNLPGFDVHILSTARTAPSELAATGAFREDLAAAVSTLVVELSPLAARPEDIPLLAQMFVERQNAAGKAQRSGLTPDAMDALCFYPWPRNAAELGEAIAAAHQQAGGPQITLDDLPAHIRRAEQVFARGKLDEPPIALDEFLEEMERELIQRALARAKGNKTKAAELLGVSRARLLRRIEQLQPKN
ncbi:MAG: hypothetical protein KDA41_05725, partial [Planctomycetales bacterium]|nr:hypothetical protein [Planctomycetales bacterium]